MALFVGTSGWAYKEWKPHFYPADLPQSKFLNHYGTQLSACEINATYYRRQEESTFEKWRDSVPDHFRFSSKAHRAISPLMMDQEVLTDYFRSVKALGPKLGAIFIQLQIKRDGHEDAFAAFLKRIPKDVPLAFDFRHASWYVAEVEEQLAEAGATMCFSEREGKLAERLPPGPAGYVRLRAEHYDEGVRDGWRELLGKEAAERDVYVFTKHEGAAAGDELAGVGLARWLVENA
ncbi:MAG: hypothetical protein QOG54_2546 [Actinomycetota bacterium]|jgi:uncharacterized protein YecE (DUF72 family)|nr:hypothetical protein [Actinomycetota bacterium]